MSSVPEGKPAPSESSPQHSQKRPWMGLGLGASILRSLFASFSLSLFQYLIIPTLALRPGWPQLFLLYLAINLTSAAIVAVLLRNFPLSVLGKIVIFSLVASFFVSYAELISGRAINSDLFFPAVPTATSIGQAFLIFSLLSIFSSILVRLLFKK